MLRPWPDPEPARALAAWPASARSLPSASIAFGSAGLGAEFDPARSEIPVSRCRGSMRQIARSSSLSARTARRLLSGPKARLWARPVASSGPVSTSRSTRKFTERSRSCSRSPDSGPSSTAWRIRFVPCSRRLGTFESAASAADPRQQFSQSRIASFRTAFDSRMAALATSRERNRRRSARRRREHKHRLRWPGSSRPRWSSRC